MSTPRAAVKLAYLTAGIGLAALLSGPGFAADNAVLPDIVLPEPPAATLMIETMPPAPEAPRSAETASPEPAAAPTVKAQASPAPAAEIALPELPEAPALFTVADQLGAAISARLADAKFQLAPKLAKKDREAIAAFYALGDYKPLWLKDQAWTPAALSVMARLGKAAEDGLDPADYPVPALGAAADKAGDLAEADLKLSAAAVLYARDARGARVDPARLSRLITPKLELPAGDAVLTRLAAAKDAGAALLSYNPPHAGYRALKAKLAEARREPSRARLEGDILANMERWRWLPADMGRRHIWVNVPEFKLRLVADGRPIHEARVIVGKPETPTPLFSDTMEHAIVNPSWYVPPSIFKNEFYSDPAYAASRGYQVVRTRDGGISVRQPPGERNALGFIKFMFPNQHAVYLHDTPNRSLFNAQKRAFSHGCVRARPAVPLRRVRARAGVERGTPAQPHRQGRAHHQAAREDPGPPDLFHASGRRQGRAASDRRPLRGQQQGPARPRPAKRRHPRCGRGEAAAASSPPRPATRPDRGAVADADVRASGLVVGDALKASGQALRPRIRHGSAQSSARDDRVGGLNRTVTVPGKSPFTKQSRATSRPRGASCS